MKKFLLGTTAIVAAASVAAPAFAADPIKLSVGGYMEQYIGFASNEDDKNVREYRSFDVQSDTEIWFAGSTTLDNGLKFSVKVEMEADGEDSGGTIDESYLDISSATLGNLRIGYEDPVTALAHNTSPNYGPGYGDADTWIPDFSKENDSYVLLGQGDEAKISYFTPRYFGFQLGATYVPELEDRRSSGNGSNNTVIPNSVNGGGDASFWVVNYADTLFGVGVKADYGYGRATGPRNRAAGGTAGGTAAYPDQVKTADGHQVGMLLSYAGFELGGAWQYSNEVHDVAEFAAGSSAENEGSVWEVGVGYKTGPWGVSLGYMESKQTDNLLNYKDDTWKVWALSGLYNMGPGIDLHGSLYAVRQKEEGGVDANYNSGGWAAVAGFKLAF